MCTSIARYLVIVGSELFRRVLENLLSFMSETWAQVFRNNVTGCQI